MSCHSECRKRGKYQKSGQKNNIDVGLRNFLRDSDENKIENPEFYEKSLRKNKEKADMKLVKDHF